MTVSNLINSNNIFCESYSLLQLAIDYIVLNINRRCPCTANKETIKAVIKSIQLLL